MRETRTAFKLINMADWDKVLCRQIGSVPKEQNSICFFCRIFVSQHFPVFTLVVTKWDQCLAKKLSTWSSESIISKFKLCNVLTWLYKWLCVHVLFKHCFIIQISPMRSAVVPPRITVAVRMTPCFLIGGVLLSYFVVVVDKLNQYICQYNALTL